MAVLLEISYFLKTFPELLFLGPSEAMKMVNIPILRKFMSKGRRQIGTTTSQ